MEAVVLGVIHLLSFVLGAALGSFVNMLTYRVHKGETLLGRSYNDFTGQPLKPIDLIPIVSFLIFKGRDRVTGKKLSIVYPLIELLLGSVTLIIFFKWFSPLLPLPEFLFALLAPLVFSVGVVFYAAYDLLYWELDKNSVVVGSLLVLVYLLLASVYHIPGFDLASRLMAGAYAYLIILVLSVLENSGLTYLDALIAFIFATFLGIEMALPAFVLSFIVGALLGLAIALVRRKNITKFQLPFVPLLSIGTLIFLLAGEQLLALL
ncbi:MAG: prepilin peptidase [Candidatus Dojkabacteria bacterium]